MFLLFYFHIGNIIFVKLYFIILVIISVEVIRLLDAVRLLLDKDAVPFAAVWSQPGVVCSEKVTFDPLTR